MTFLEIIPPAIPNVYDHDRAVLLLHFFRYEMCLEALEKHTRGDWRVAVREQEASDRDELVKLNQTAPEKLGKVARERLTTLQRAVTPYAIESRRAFHRTAYHMEAERLRLRLDGYRLALNAALGLPEDFCEDEKVVPELA